MRVDAAISHVFSPSHMKRLTGDNSDPSSMKVTFSSSHNPSSTSSVTKKRILATDPEKECKRRKIEEMITTPKKYCSHVRVKCRCKELAKRKWRRNLLRKHVKRSKDTIIQDNKAKNQADERIESIDEAKADEEGNKTTIAANDSFQEEEEEEEVNGTF